MTKRLWFVSLVVMALAVAPAVAEQGQVKAPKMTVPQHVKDFGIVPQGKILEANFQIVNEGTDTLEIKAVRPTCGCTVAKFDKTVAPGKAGMVRAKVDTSEFKGPIAKSILVMTNDPETPTVRLVVKAEVQPYLEVLPRPLVRFNAIRGEKTVEKLTVVSDRNEPFKVTKVETNVPYITASFRKLGEDELIKGKYKDQYEVALTMNGDAPVGPISAAAVIHTTHPKQPKLEVRIFGVVRALLHVTPSQVQFGTVDPKDKPGRNVIVLNNRKGVDVHIKDLRIDDPAFEVQAFTMQEGKRYQITIAMKPDASAGQHKATLTILTDDPDHPEIKVPVVANVAAGK